MVMSSSGRSSPASTFKAKCLALLDRVAETGEPLVVTKRGRPVARVVPMLSRQSGSLRGSVTVRGDIVGPILDSWDLDR
jgi:prevent-host-death family protein